MRYNEKFGYSCPTPIEKSADGKTVLKWCDWKPAPETPNPNYTPKMAEVAKETREKLDMEESPVTRTYEEKRSYRIEKQHQTEMALFWFQVRGIEDFTDAELEARIDWFMQDLDR